MNPSDDIRTFRHRLGTLAAAVERLLTRQGGPTCQAIIIQTKAVGTYPTTAGAYYACNVVTPGGTEAEGAVATTTAGTRTVFALNVGKKKPPVGTKAVAIVTDGRLVFQYDGSET